MLITVRLTPEQEAAYALGYGISRADLKPGVQAEYDRILAERRAGPPGTPGLPEPAAPGVNTRLRRFVTWVGVVLGSLWALFFIGFVVYAAVNEQMNFQLLRSDLAMVHLPPGYHLVAERQLGTNCRNQCSITQTWAWTHSGQRSTSAACADILRALTAAYPSSPPEANSPIPAHASCDYFSIPPTDFLQAKRAVEAIVQTHTASGFLIELTDSYDY